MQKETNRKKKKVNSSENKANKSKATKKKQHKAPIESPKKL